METTTAGAVFILGDWFDAWVGDDACTDFEHRACAVVRAASQRLSVHVMHGNRDFTLGAAFLAACGAQALPDPCLLAWGQARHLLSHGDAWCTTDRPYMAFRAQSRTRAWQDAFLSIPVVQRRAQVAAMRAQSESTKAAQMAADWVDVVAAEVAHSACNAGATSVIHGHTHQGLDFWLDLHPTATLAQAAQRIQRHVTLDWDLHAQPPRAQVLRIAGERVSRYTLGAR